ncbi:MAG: hypothetical protein KDH84_12145, partial [Calditrichaeota bacterium]|nr:hypothetical protein [Calditrichota bacterium]
MNNTIGLLSFGFMPILSRQTNTCKHFPLAVGYWLLVIGCWLWVIGCWLLVIGKNGVGQKLTA